MRWLRRIILLGVLSSRAIVLLRRRTAPTSPSDGIGPEWPPLSVPEAADTTAGTIADPAAAPSDATWKPAVDGACPDGYPIKVATSSIFHLPGGRSYARTHPERCYARGEDAEADGYRRAKL